MSQENVEAFNRAVDAINSGDVKGLRTFFDHQEALEAAGLAE